MNKQNLLLHLSFIMLSFPALFARGIDMSAGLLSWWRCLIGAVVAMIILLITRKISVSKKDIKWIVPTGILMGLHWWTYFASVQLAGVAIGLIALFTFPIITVMLEPVFLKTKVSYKQVIGGFGIIAGVFFLVPDLSLQNDTTLGVLLGVTSAIFISVRNILTRKHLSHLPAFTTIGYHLIFAFLILSVPLLTRIETFEVPSFNELGLIAVLATVFTLGSHGLMVYNLKNFTAATIGILGSLQVVYGTFLAYLVFREVPTPNFYFGVVIILGIAAYEMLPLNVNKRKATKN